ncbi:endolytic transglycosylase MltG [Acetobacteraceae bacterium]|nr:endolytic transglycosylase MltG [Candidatus Parcubacteria bacterium]
MYIGLAAFLCLALYIFTITAPFSFEEGVLIQVPSGESIRSVGALLKEKGLIRSSMAFEAVVRASGGSIIAGEYSFQQRDNIVQVGRRLAGGDFRITPVRIKIPEGSTVRNITDLLTEKIADFDGAQFYRLAQSKEGYLFPDTYFILPGATPQTVLGMMQNAFEENVLTPNVEALVKASGKSLSEIVIMASLLEKEVPDTYDRRVIAGILWKRIKLGMPLQVDAVFPYIIGKNSFELTRADLRIDSLYNTYVYKGLPVGPIANPSLDAIIAAATPIQTEYLYYLSDMQSNLHYAATYDQHLTNKATYLGS